MATSLFKAAVALLFLPLIAYFMNVGANALWLQWLVWCSIAVGVGLLILVITLSHQANQPQAHLNLLFATAYYTTLIGALLLLPAHVLLLIGAVWSFLQPLGALAFVSLQCLIPLGLALLIVIVSGLFYVIRAFVQSIRSPMVKTVAYELKASDAPVLWAEVAEVASQVQAPAPQSLIVGCFDGFYVTMSPLQCLNGRPAGPTLHISLPDLWIFTMADFRAVIGHELAHIRARDVELTREFFPLFRSAMIFLQSLQPVQQIDLESQFKILLAFVNYLLFTPLRLILEIVIGCFLPLERAQRRQREFAADAVSAQIVGQRQAAITLVKAHAFEEAALNTSQVVRYKALHEDQEPLKNISEWFAASAAHYARPALLDNLEKKEIRHPLDTHPILQERLQALDLSLAEVGLDAIALPVAEPASHQLLPNHRIIEEALSTIIAALPHLSFEEAAKYAPGLLDQA